MATHSNILVWGNSMERVGYSPCGGKSIGEDLQLNKNKALSKTPASSICRLFSYTQALVHRLLKLVIGAQLFPSGKSCNEHYQCKGKVIV